MVEVVSPACIRFKALIPTNSTPELAVFDSAQLIPRCRGLSGFTLSTFSTSFADANI
jgi:hypothetical protein